jgi:hypothetical protein
MAVGGALIALVGWLWGRGAAVGGAVALAAQLWAVVLLRPAMRAPMPRFMGRWLGGMAVRALAMAGVLVTAVARPDVLPLLAAALGFLAVLLPLLFLETRFLR